MVMAVAHVRPLSVGSVRKIDSGVIRLGVARRVDVERYCRVFNYQPKASRTSCD